MSRRKREQKAAEEREAEERALRQADSLERSGENEYLYNRIVGDSALDSLNTTKPNDATSAGRADSVAVKASAREK